MAERIKALVRENPGPSSFPRNPDTNTYCLTSQHITWAAFLPEGHPVRGVLAMAAVEGYLQSDHHKFQIETQEVPNFSADLLKAVKATLKTLSWGDRNDVTFNDPISGTTVSLRK